MAININQETIKRLADEVGDETVSILFNVFSDELEQYLRQLSDQPTVTQIGDISHAVKSSAASFGADDLALMAQECESRVKQEQDHWVVDRLPEFRTMVEETAHRYKQLASNNDLINSML